jgi:NitT/TauT family transport system substrate-binding protein
MKRIRILLSAVTAVCAFIGLSGNVSAETIRVSYQNRETALPLYIATEKGFWKDVGLEPDISVFVSGPPQIAAASSWDVGITGGPPAALGAARFGLLVMAIATDESALNAMLARESEKETIIKDPTFLKNKQLLVTTNTTGEYAALACLKKFGLAKSDMQVVNLAPAQIISAFSSGSGTLATTWTPFAYALQDKGGVVELCNGEMAGAVIISTLVVRSDFAKEKPDLVAKALAVYLHAVVWMRQHPAEAVEYLKRYNEKSGVLLSESSLDRTIARSKTFTLPEELRAFDRSSGAAPVDKWMSDLSGYLVGTGTLVAVQDPKTYLDDHYLGMIQSDPKLRNFANGD